MDSKTIQTYNEMALEYDAETLDFWERFPKTIIDEFVKRIGKGKVADIGSGPGRDGSILQKNGLKVVCLDASLAMVDMCKRRGLEAIVGDLLHIPFEDGEFDGVWAYTSLLHIPKTSIDNALNEINRILKKKGIFGLGLIEGEGEAYRTSSGINKTRFFAYYTKKEIEQFLGEAQFDIEYFETFKPGSKSYLNYILRKRL